MAANISRDLTSLPTKACGLGLRDPTHTADDCHKASSSLSKTVTEAILDNSVAFSLSDHFKQVKEAKADFKADQLATYGAQLRGVLNSLPPEQKRVVQRGTTTGHWLSAYPNPENGTELSALEFRDGLFTRYGVSPPNIPLDCDGCDTICDHQHLLNCKVGGLIHQRHDDVAHELGDLAQGAFSYVRYNPAIQVRQSSGPSSPTQVDSTDDNADPNNNDGIAHVENTDTLENTQDTTTSTAMSNDRGDILIRGLWSTGTDTIIDVRLTNLDTQCQRGKDPDKILKEHEEAKNKKYKEPCKAQRREFSPFVASLDGFIGKTADKIIKKLSRALSEKWSKSYSAICGYVRSRISIALVRATHLSLRGSRIPASKISNKRPTSYGQADPDPNRDPTSNQRPIWDAHGSLNLHESILE